MSSPAKVDGRKALVGNNSRHYNNINVISKTRANDASFTSEDLSADSSDSQVGPKSFATSDDEITAPAEKRRLTYKQVQERKLLSKKTNIAKLVDVECGFTSTKRKIRDSIKQVPRKYRGAVSSIIKTNEFKDKFMIDKGLIGNKGAIDKVVKEIEMIEEHALEKIMQARINMAKKKATIMDPIRENQKDLMKERLERRFHES